MELEFRITGIVRERETRRPLPGLIVRAYDKDLLYDDLLGSVTTDSSGCFEIRYAGSDFQEIFDRRPDIYFKVLDPSGERLLHSTSDAVRWNAGKNEYVQIEVPAVKLPPSGQADPLLIDAQGRARSDFEVGDSLMIRLQDLEPDSAHVVRLLDDRDDEVLRVSLLSNRFGVIAPTVLWPDIGIGIPEKGGRFAFENLEQALSGMAGKTFAMEISAKGAVTRKQRFTIVGEISQKRLYPASGKGALQRGLLMGQDELRVQGRNFTAGSLIDLYLVKRRLNWRPEDPIVPVRNPDGTEVVATARLEADQNNFEMVLWPRERLQPGSYDIIARVAIPHEYLRHERILRASDFISERFITTLVIRDDIFHYKPIKQGCVMATKEIAAKMLWGVPEEILYTNNFPKGTDVWASLDPAGLMPAAIGKKIRYCVLAHKTPLEWTTSSSVLPSIPGTGAEIITTSSCVNGNAALVWSNPQQAGQYDLVVDFGNNDPNPANFVADDSFDPPLDMIDGYLNVGFYVTEDPSIPGPFSVGQTSFNDPAVTIPATGVWSPSGTTGGTMSGTLSLPMIAEVRYPAATNGVNVPVSPLQASYPVVVIMHGMHTPADPSYLGYNYLLDHLASQGFVAVSIDCNAINSIGGMQDTRGRAILAHLTLLQSKNTNAGLFQGKIDLARIGIMGHSRGGDGVVQAEIFNQSLALGWNILAIVALAPTDFSGISPTPLNLTTSKFLSIYGSNDGDVWGGTNPSTQYTGTGFRFYDRATTEKAMVFIYGATHNRFNTQWGTESRVDSSSPKVLSQAQHQTLLRGYMTAFMQVHLLGRAEQGAYFSGELKIPQASMVETYTQYRSTAHLTLDDFESAPSLNQNTLGGNVVFANLDGAPQEDVLGIIDGNSPHQTKGIRLKWNASTARYQSDIPLVGTQRNVSARRFLSFRVAQKVGSAANPANLLQDLHVRLSMSGGGNSRAVRAGYFGAIPFPYTPEYISAYNSSEGPNTKAAMTTVRIPLYAWTIKCLNVPIVDLTDVESIAFEFDYRPTGEIEIDDLEFTD